jgi:NAD(P)-dependent dehydrogenase (short-subunit alcohol dehydrogenase family)
MTVTSSAVKVCPSLASAGSLIHLRPMQKVSPPANANTLGAALVTGAGRRLGRAIALELAARGRPVAVHYNASDEDATAVVREIEMAGGTAAAVAADLREDGDIAGLVSRAAGAVGPITCLINNASVFEHDRLDTATPESWDLHIAVNLRAPFFLIQAFAAALPEDTEGNVINMLDERVLNLTPYFASYTVSKMGLWTLTKTLALELAPRIRVNGIGPGPTLPSAHQSNEQFRRQWQMMPLARQVMPEEIARTVSFILDTPSMTGQMIALDGGQHLGWAQPFERSSVIE